MYLPDRRNWGRCLLSGLVAIVASVSSSARCATPLEHRWVFLQVNLQRNEEVTRTEAILRRAAAAGYNGFVLADYKLNVLNRVSGDYFKHLEKIKTLAEQLKLEIIPAVMPFGYSEGILTHAPDLAEGIPVVDAAFVVRDGVARLVSAGQNLLPGGGFEEHKRQAAVGWSYQDFPGTGSFIDTEVKHSGRSSLRFENLAQAAQKAAGNGRVNRTVSVSPLRQYHASIWIKTENFNAAADVRMFAIGKDGRVLSHSYLGVKSTQDWTEHQVVFNSLDNDQVLFYCGTWGGRQGKLWMDDARLEEVAFVNLLRRDGCPLTVESTAGQPFEEGQDYERLVDPKMGHVRGPGSYDVYHEPPQLKILPGSKIREGDPLRVSFYHAVTVHEGQVACCLNHPEVFRIIEDQVRRVEQLLKPKTYLLSHDEIRVANWCGSCLRPKGMDGNAGRALEENIRQCVAILRRINPGARLCFWSDMFDPSHNAVDKYYLVNGDWAGAWEGLPKDALIVNWNQGHAEQSLPWFHGRGHSQVLAGYYDGNPASIADWLRIGGDSSGVRGAMYTTWQGNFQHLEAFAQAAWGPL